jgi:multiple antibiotic resistance protein
LLVYLIDLVETLTFKTFSKVLIRAAAISGACYIFFAFIGENIFLYVFQADFASFQIFGGLIFLITGIRFVFEGNKAVAKLKGDPEHLEGGIVLPIMVGPGTISASIIVGKKLNMGQSSVVIVLSLVVCVVVLLLLQRYLSNLKKKKEKLLLRYVDIIGRVSALLIGTFSVEMIMNGIRLWVSKF